MAQPASPSPPPTAPLAQTPGPRATALSTLHTSTLTATLSAVNLANFSACFPGIAKSAPLALHALHQGFVTKLRELAEEEFRTILKEKNVVEALNGFEGVLAEARRRKKDAGEGAAPPVAPHTLCPGPLLNAYMTPLYTQQNSQLNAKIQTAASTNASLASDIAEQRRQIKALMQSVRAAVADVQSAGGILADGVEKGELVHTGRRVDDMAMQGT